MMRGSPQERSFAVLKQKLADRDPGLGLHVGENCLFFPSLHIVSDVGGLVSQVLCRREVRSHFGPVL